MSCDWDVYCRTCDSELGLEDQNHREDLMLALIAAAPALAVFAETAANSEANLQVTAGWSDFRLNVGWFRAHAGHELVPKNEYGQCLDECGGRFTCNASEFHKCKLPKAHEGKHGPRRTPH